LSPSSADGIHPETSLYITDPEYRKAVNPLTGALPNETDIGTTILAYRELTKRGVEYRKKTAAKFKDGSRSRIEDLWKGGFTIAHHDQDAEVVLPSGLQGDYSKRVMVQNLPIWERRLYCVTVNYDIFSSAMSQIGTRAEIGFWRNEAELNYLRFLPPKTRVDVFKRLNKSPPGYLIFTQFKEKNQLHKVADLATGVQYKTDDPEKEFLDQFIAYVGDAIPTDDPIARPKPGAKADRVTQALQLIDEEGDTPQTWFKTMLPEITLLRIDSKGKDPTFYSLTLDWDVVNTESIAGSINHYPDDGLDEVTIYPGVQGYYPNFIFRIDEEDVMDFAKKLTAADDIEKFTAVVERWGVRRTNPEFWSIFHSITDYVRRTNPRKAAVLDANRYRDF
jgi:hypothetical protein